MKIKFITGNAKKFEEAQHVLLGWDLEHVNIDLEEIQGERNEVVKQKAKSALAILKTPLILEDVSLCCGAINGLPGPYVKDFLRILGTQGLYELIHKFDDHSVEAVCMAAYVKPGIEPVLFEGVLEGEVVAPRGDTKHGPYSFNQVFLPKGHNKTMGEMTMKEHAEVSHRRKALKQLQEYLETHETP